MSEKDLAQALAEREMQALRARNRLTAAEVEQRWAWMSVALRDMQNVEDVVDRVCKQALEAIELRAALAEALDQWKSLRANVAGRRVGGPDGADRMQLERIAELRAKHLEGK